MNIEDIKEALNEVDHPEYEFRGYCYTLLYIIEQAEKALELAKEQIESDTFAIEWEVGKCRGIEEMIKENDMPDAWNEVVAALKSIQGDE